MNFARPISQPPYSTPWQTSFSHRKQTLYYLLRTQNAQLTYRHPSYFRTSHTQNKSGDNAQDRGAT